MHLESKLAAIRAGDLPGHLDIFMHIKIGQVQVQNSRGHTSNVMPPRVVQQWYRILLDRLSCCLQPTPLLSPRFSQIYLDLHVSTCPWVRFTTDFSFDSDLPTVISASLFFLESLT